MRILFICEEYPPGKTGGIGTVVKTLSRQLVAQGHQVYVVGLYPHGYGEADYEEEEGIKIWRLRYYTDTGIISNNFSRTDKLLFRLLKYSLLLQLDTLLSVKRLFRLIEKITREEGIDIIEMADWNTFFQNSFIKIKVPPFSAPLLVKFHGSYSYCRKELNLPIKNYVYSSEIDLMRRADALGSVSRYTAARTTLLYNLSRPVEILYNSINPGGPDPAPYVNRKRILFIGSLLYIKGIHSLLEAWNIVIEKHPDAVLEVYGKGDIRLLKLLLGPAAMPTVHFNGHVSRQTLFDRLAEATAMVAPSYSECFAMAPLEAMVAGCAVINTSRASGSELVSDKENGLLVDPDNRQQIASAIVLLLEDNELRNSLAAAGKRTIVRKFAIQDSVLHHIRFYESIIREFKQINPTPASDEKKPGHPI